jgi:hypothetical protein
MDVFWILKCEDKYFFVVVGIQEGFVSNMVVALCTFFHLEKNKMLLVFFDIKDYSYFFSIFFLCKWSLDGNYNQGRQQQWCINTENGEGGEFLVG